MIQNCVCEREIVCVNEREGVYMFVCVREGDIESVRERKRDRERERRRNKEIVRKAE